MQVAVSNGDVILIIVFVTIPVAAIAFIANAGHAFKSIGKGGLSVEFESDNPRGMVDTSTASEAQINEAELRQMLEAKAYRQQARGEAPLDVEEELAKALAEQRSPSSPGTEDAQLREEVRQLVVARSDRRVRQGKEPLDIDAEVERQLRELENLGQ